MNDFRTTQITSAMPDHENSHGAQQAAGPDSWVDLLRVVYELIANLPEPTFDYRAALYHYEQVAVQALQVAFVAHSFGLAASEQREVSADGLALALAARPRCV